MIPFQVPLHRALTQPMLIGGAPREFAILNIVLTSSMLFSLKSPLGLPLGLFLHAVSVALAKKDPYFFHVIQRALLQKKLYEA